MEPIKNIAKILKNKPEKTILYDIMRDINVSLYDISTSYGKTDIFCDGIEGYKGNNFIYSDTGADYIFRKGIQLLKPSKEMQDWNKFAWKRGDVLSDGESMFIFYDWSNKEYTEIIAKHSISLNNTTAYRKEIIVKTCNCQLIQDSNYLKRFSNLFPNNEINLKTLEIQNFQFEDGDIVVYGKSIAICKKICKHTLYFYVSLDENSGILFDDNRTSEICKLATNSEKQKLFIALKKEGKYWNAEKKVILDLPKFKAFDKVLVREYPEDSWIPRFFSGMSGSYIICTDGNAYSQCIPYNEQTENLTYTTDDWEGGEE